jgi:hypothetical protein
MTASPGWYPDPAASEDAAPGLRWWDGNQWTEHLQPAAGAASPSAQGSYGQPAQPAAFGQGVPAVHAGPHPMARFWQAGGRGLAR